MRWAFCKRARVLDDALTPLSIVGTMKIPIAWVDAFSDVAFGGNPAAVCLLDEPMGDGRMQSIAFELGIAETAYLTPTDDPTAFGLRWFSPAVEIDLCGHATLASAHALREAGIVDGTAPLTFHTRGEPFRATFAGDTIELDFPADPVTPGPVPASLQEQWPGHVVASGHTNFFTFVALSVGRGGRRLRARAGRHRRHRGQGAAPDRRRVRPIRVPTTSCASSGPTWGSTRIPPRGRRSVRRDRTGRLSWGVTTLVAHQLSRRGATLYVRPDEERVRIAGHATTVLTGELC